MAKGSHVLLRDPERATSVSQEFKELQERGGRPWKPEKKTQGCWRDVLALNENEAVYGRQRHTPFPAE